MLSGVNFCHSSTPAGCRFSSSKSAGLELISDDGAVEKGTTRAWVRRMVDWQPAYQDGQNIRDRTFEFACAVVEFCKMLSAAGGPARLMVGQLLGCSNSVAAMLEEARAAESKRDFISKCCVGLKEAREAHVRLRVCHRTGLGPPETALALIQEANQIISIITAIVRNTRRNVHMRLPAGKRPFASRNS